MKLIHLIPFISGFIFSLGLALSGMTLPQKVIGFLDIFGKWDPSLAFVMIGAIGVHFVLFRVITKKSSPLFDHKFHVPNKSDIDKKLILGSVLFGIGWGIGGYCPGPALTSLATLQLDVLVFVGSMIVGMFVFKKTIGQTKV